MWFSLASIFLLQDESNTVANPLLLPLPNSFRDVLIEDQVTSLEVLGFLTHSSFFCNLAHHGLHFVHLKDWVSMSRRNV
jgi:hypothetical protein